MKLDFNEIKYQIWCGVFVMSLRIFYMRNIRSRSSDFRKLYEIKFVIIIIFFQSRLCNKKKNGIYCTYISNWELLTFNNNCITNEIVEECIFFFLFFCRNFWLLSSLVGGPESGGMVSFLHGTFYSSRKFSQRKITLFCNHMQFSIFSFVLFCCLFSFGSSTICLPFMLQFYNFIFAIII